MSKARVVGLTRSLAAEHLKPPLRINAIAPAGTRTNIAASNPFPPDMDPTSPAAWAGCVAWRSPRRSPPCSVPRLW